MTDHPLSFSLGLNFGIETAMFKTTSLAFTQNFTFGSQFVMHTNRLVFTVSPLGKFGFVLKSDGSETPGFAQVDIPDSSEVWLTIRLGLTAEALAFWTAPNSGNYVGFAEMAGVTTYYLADQVAYDDYWFGASEGNFPVPVVGYQTVEIHHDADATLEEFYVDGKLVYRTTGAGGGDATNLSLGITDQGTPDPNALIYVEYVKIGTTRGGTEIFSDDFASGNLDAWTLADGDISVVPDPFGGSQFAVTTPGTLSF